MLQSYFPPHISEVMQFDPSEILTDAARMQFKEGGDKYGVTDQLKKVKQWDSNFANNVFIWQALDGKLYIADGHQRLGLAKRLKKDKYGKKILLNGFLFREKDGWAIEKMRAYAAAKNITEGGESTKAIDVAKLLRNGGPTDLLDKHVPPQRRCLKDGKSLAKLSDECFKLIINNIIPESWGIAVGERIDDHAEQLGIIEFLKEQRPSAENVPALIEEALQAGFADVVQSTLFGERDFKRSLIAERIAIFKHCGQMLTKWGKALTYAVENAAELKRCGTIIDVEQVEYQKQIRAIQHQLIGQARKKGELSDSLTQAARVLFESKGNVQRAADMFMAALELFSLPHTSKLAPPKKINGNGIHLDMFGATVMAPTDEPEAILPMFMPTDDGAQKQPGLI